MVEILPRLREEIEISSTEESQWTLYDRATGKYYRLNELSFTILSLLHQAADKDKLLELVKHHILTTMVEIDETLDFCERNFLFRTQKENIDKLIVSNAKKASVHWYSKLIHGYLFFKIHLFNPDQFLTKTLGSISFVYSNKFFLAITVLLIINLFFIFNRFTEFVSTLTNFSTIEGLLYMALSIIIVKLFHEFGHAYTAKRAGCTVPSMGIAFMVFYPMPYTDTSDAWKLPRKQRMQIALAGIKTEIIMAVFAMLGWLWLADGPLKSIAFFMIAVSLVSTLAINLTPFMRYDGYYALSDYMGIENLHSRSFLQAKAFVKNILWGIVIPVEYFPSKIRTFLILFAFLTWIYRVILFSGIAYLVYSHTFKMLGIILFWIEIWYFILQPIIREMKEWIHLKSQMRLRLYSILAWLIVIMAGLILFIPYSTTIRLPAVMDSNQITNLYTDYDSQIIFIRPEGKVKKGDLILSVHSIVNDLERKTSQRKLELFQQQSMNAFISEDTLRDSGKFLQSARGESAKVDVANSIRDNMNIYASESGVLLYDQKFVQGEFVGTAQKIGMIINPKGATVTAYIGDVYLSQIKESLDGEFFDYLTLEKIKVKIKLIDNTPVDVLNEPLLNSNYKGNITVERDNVTQRPQYKIKLIITNALYQPIYYQHYGEIKIKVQYKSFFERIKNAIVSVFIHESAF